MQGSLGGDIIFTSTLDYFPRLSIPYPVFSSLSHFDIPSSECMQSIVFKLLIIKGSISIEQFLQSVVLVGKQDTFANKILLIYAVALCIIPLSNTFDRKNQKRPLGQQTNYVMKISINKNERKSTVIKLEIISIGNKNITKDQAIWNGWNKISKQIHKYKMEIIRKQDKNYVGYSQQLQQYGIKLPSTVCLQRNEDIQLIYFNDKFRNGIQIRQYILLMSFNTQRQSYDFDKFLTNLAKQLRYCIKKENSNNRYYFCLSFSNIFICQGKRSLQIAIQINIEPSKNDKKLTQNNKKSNYAYQHLHLESNYSKADYWSAGIILLQAIALNSKIFRFKRQFDSCKTYDQKNIYLDEFIKFIEDQRLIVNPNLILTIKKWLQLDINSDPASSANKQSVNENSIDQMQKIYAPYENSDFLPQLPLQKEQLISENEINIEQYIWKLQTLIFQHENQINCLIALNITQISLPEIQEAILQPSFLTFFGFSTISCTLQQSIKCKKCKKNQILYINYCGHGQCYSCFTKYLKSKVQQPNEKLITCKQCKKSLSVDIITIILQGNSDLKKLFCNLFIVQYIQNIQKRYIYCLNLRCLKSPLIYLKGQSKILLCQNCKIAYCSACRKKLHYPLDCDQFKQQQNEIASQAQALLKDIGLPNFTSNKETVKLYEQLLGNQHKLISISTKMVKQLLILNCCANRSHQTNKHMSMFKQLSKRIVSILKAIQLFCKGEKLSAQTDDLIGLHKARQNILISIFIQ